MKYLLTITCQQKKAHITKYELDIIIEWLIQCGVKIETQVYEKHGLYSQLHVHAIVEYEGRYSNLTKWGDEKLYNSFRIHWKRIRNNYKTVISYLHKQDENQALIRNVFEEYYYDQDSQEFLVL